MFSHALISALWVYNRRTLTLEGDFQCYLFLNQQVLSKLLQQETRMRKFCLELHMQRHQSLLRTRFSTTKILSLFSCTVILNSPQKASLLLVITSIQQAPWWEYFQGQVPTSAQSGVTASWSSKIKKRVYGLLSALSQLDKLAVWFYFHFVSHSLEK